MPAQSLQELTLHMISMCQNDFKIWRTIELGQARGVTFMTIDYDLLLAITRVAKTGQLIVNFVRKFLKHI